MATVPILWDPIPVSVTLVGLEQTVVKVIFSNNHSQVENHKLYKKKPNCSPYEKIENSQTFMNNLSKNNMRRYFFHLRQKVIVLRCYQFYLQILMSVSKHHVSIMVPV